VIWLMLFYGVVVLSLGIFLLWISRELDKLRRLGAVLIFMVTIGVTVFAFTELLSRPRPDFLNLFPVKESEVLGISLAPGDGIYLWVREDPQAMPRYYVLVWDKGMAEDLREMLRNQTAGQTLRVRDRYASWRRDRTDLFYLVERPPPIDKTQEDSSVLYYNPEQR